MIKHLVGLGFLCFAWLVSIAQQPCGVRLSGIVRSVSGEPLPGAIVRAVGHRKSVQSDVDGRFAMQRLCPGDIVLQLELLANIELNGS